MFILCVRRVFLACAFAAHASSNILLLFGFGFDPSVALLSLLGD